jgi:hypothetical protein
MGTPEILKRTMEHKPFFSAKILQQKYPDVLAAFEAIAAEDGVSVDELVLRALKEYVARERPQNN